jgi:hypothetical protein
MARLKVPSALHTARLWRPTAEGVQKELIKLADSSPPFSYTQLLNMTRSVLMFKSNLGEMESLIRISVRSELAQRSYLEIAPLLSRTFLN